MELELKKREAFGSTKSKQLRKQGFIPGVIYSGGQEAAGFVVSELHFQKTADKARRNLVYKVKSDDKDLSGLEVVIREVQTEAIKGKLLHIDLVSLDKDRLVRVAVPLNLVGTPASVKSGTGILQQSAYFVNVRALPKDIPDSLELDVSGLDNGDSSLAGDIKLPSGVALHTSKATAIALVLGKAKRADDDTATAGAEAGGTSTEAPAAA